MKTYSKILVAFLGFSLGLVFIGCEKEGECDEVNISSSVSTESHNFGMNCMQCHVSGGEGEGCFSVAGSTTASDLSNHLTSGKIKLFTGSNGSGTLKHVIDIDGKGNFHTTEQIDMTGLYPAITGSNGTTHYMSSSPGNGACNKCHGLSTDPIWAN
jgi:hypothetical protein